MAIVIVIGFEVIDIHQQDKVLAIFYRRQVLQTALQTATIIEPGKRVHHAEIGKGFSLFQQAREQFLSETVVTRLQNVMNSNCHHRKCERIGHSQPYIVIA